MAPRRPVVPAVAPDVVLVLDAVLQQRLVKGDAALAHARAQGLRVRPVCSYVQVYMRRHPDTQDLLER